MIKSKPLHNVSQGYWSLKSTRNHTCDQDMNKKKKRWIQNDIDHRDLSIEHRSKGYENSSEDW